MSYSQAPGSKFAHWTTERDLKGLNYKNMRVILLGLLAILLLSFPTESYASAVELVVGQNVNVYAKPRRGAPIIKTLPRGSRVPVSSRSYGRWRKVLVVKHGKKRIGYVRVSQLRGSSIAKKKLRKRETFTYKDDIGVGFNFAFSNTSQSEREFDDGEGSSKVLSDMSGSSTFFGLFGDFPLSDYFTLRMEVTFRENSFTGDFGIAGEDTQTVELTQSFFAIGGMVKAYPFPAYPYWGGLGVEFANGTSVNLVYANDGEVEVDSEDLPFFIFVHGVVGADFHIWNHVYLIPDIRFGSVVNTDPSITSIEGRLSFAYRF